LGFRPQGATPPKSTSTMKISRTAPSMTFDSRGLLPIQQRKFGSVYTVG